LIEDNHESKDAISIFINILIDKLAINLPYHPFLSGVL